MSTIQDIRHANLLALLGRFKTLQAFADAIDRPHSQVSQLKNKSKHSASGEPRTIGDDLSRHIEAKLGKPNGWMDVHHRYEGQQEATVLVAHEMSHPKFQTGPNTANQVPVIGTLSLGDEQMFELRAAPDGEPIGHVIAYTDTKGSYALQVFGDHLYPAVRHGACLVIDPAGQCIEGELMLMELTSGNYVVCELVAMRGDTVTWVPAAGGTRHTIARSEITAMHPVIDNIPGSRMKARSGA